MLNGPEWPHDTVFARFFQYPLAGIPGSVRKNRQKIVILAILKQIRYEIAVLLNK